LKVGKSFLIAAGLARKGNEKEMPKTLMEIARAELDKDSLRKKVESAKKLIIEIDQLEESVKSDTNRLASLKTQLERLSNNTTVAQLEQEE
jgi:hypothetical protein